MPDDFVPVDQAQCDVAQACHHRSEDVSDEFQKAMEPAVTVICSGDNEPHDHRPSIVAASATTGYIELGTDELVSPLIYSTELARSVSRGEPFQLEERDAGKQPLRGAQRRRRVQASEEAQLEVLALQRVYRDPTS